MFVMLAPINMITVYQFVVVLPPIAPIFSLIVISSNTYQSTSRRSFPLPPPPSSALDHGVAVVARSSSSLARDGLCPAA
jgi:hypothetical protein